MKTNEQVQAFQQEMQAWMEKNDLTGDTAWRTPEEHYGEPQKESDDPVYLVLWFEGDLNHVMWLLPDHPGRDWHRQMRAEFDAIVDRHGFWYDFVDNVTMYFKQK